MGLFVYTQKGSIISMVDLPTTEIIEPEKLTSRENQLVFSFFYGLLVLNVYLLVYNSLASQSPSNCCCGDYNYISLRCFLIHSSAQVANFILELSNILLF